MATKAPNRTQIKSLNNLINAIRRGDRTAIYRILDTEKVDLRDKRLRAVPMNAACSGNDVEVVRALIERGAHISAYNAILRPYQSDPLIVACASIDEKKDIIQCLIDAGCDVNTRDNHGWTSLHWACARGNAGSVRLLLDAGALVNSISGDFLTSLELASYGADAELIRLLLDAGADASKRAGEYMSNCITYRCSEGVELLYKACPEATIRNSKSFQGRMRHFCQRTSMLEEEPDRDYSDEVFMRVPVLHAVCSVSYDPHQMLKKLLRIGADVDQKDQFGLTCFQYVCSNLHVQSAKVLLDNGVNPSKHGWSPLWKCFPPVCQNNYRNYVRLLKLLVQAGFKLDRESMLEFSRSAQDSDLSNKDMVSFVLFLHECWTVPCRLSSLCRRRVCQLLPPDVSVSAQKLKNDLPRTLLQYLQDSELEEVVAKAVTLVLN